MKKSEMIRQKPSIRLMQERYEYWERVPYPGLVIDHKPAITQVDIDQVGDYLIYLVRDPLGAYGQDPAERRAGEMEDAIWKFRDVPQLYGNLQGGQDHLRQRGKRMP